MESVTLGQILAVITFLVAIISGIGYLSKVFNKGFTNMLNTALDPTNKKIDELFTKIDGVDEKVDELEKNLSGQIEALDTKMTTNYIMESLDEAEYKMFMSEDKKKDFWEYHKHLVTDLHVENEYLESRINDAKKKGYL